MKNIASALVKAQKTFQPALKDATNPFYKSKYADLGNCLEAVMDSLNNNGISLVQLCHESDTGVIVETMFIHESGEQLSCGKLHVPAIKQDPQQYGSALTYARRYSLMAACGIAPEDDDGNATKFKPIKTDKVASPNESGKSIPKDVFDSLQPDEQIFLSEIAMEIVAALSDGDLKEVHRLFYENNLDQDEQTAIWHKLDSKQRSSIKKYKDSLKQST